MVVGICLLGRPGDFPGKGQLTSSTKAVADRLQREAGEGKAIRVSKSVEAYLACKEREGLRRYGSKTHAPLPKP